LITSFSENIIGCYEKKQNGVRDFLQIQTFCDSGRRKMDDGIFRNLIQNILKFCTLLLECLINNSHLLYLAYPKEN